MTTPTTTNTAAREECCRQSPCLHPGVGPCDKPATQQQGGEQEAGEAVSA